MNRHLKCFLKVLFSPLICVVQLLFVLIFVFIFPLVLVGMSGCVDTSNIEHIVFIPFGWYSEL